jgi:hypothetical protein
MGKPWLTKVREPLIEEEWSLMQEKSRHEKGQEVRKAYREVRRQKGKEFWVG